MTQILEMPDIESFTWNTLKSLGGIHVFTYDAQSPWPYVTDIVALQIDVRASTKKAARDRAYEVRRIMLETQLDATTPVARCEVVSGPMWVPEQDGAPRYILRVSVTVRGNRA